MSSYLNDYGLTNEINLTISSFAYQIIIEDIKNFIYKVDKSNFSKFCSIIFLSYYNFILQLVDQESQPGYGINL